MVVSDGLYISTDLSLVGVTRLSRHVLLHFSCRAGISNISPANTVITISNIPLIKSFSRGGGRAGHWPVVGVTGLTLSGGRRMCRIITRYFQAMIFLAGTGSFLLSLPALQSVTLILTTLIRRHSLSSAKAGQFLGFLQKKLCIYYHPFTRSEGKTLSPRL